jgi:hypothetical protein
MHNAHWHLLFNHMPIMGCFFGFLVLIAGIMLKNEIVRKVAYSLLILSSLLTLPAFFTGESAEEAIEHLPGVSHHLIHEHEEAAEAVLWLAEILGLLAAYVFYLEHTRHKMAGLLRLVLVVFNLGTFAAMAKTGNSGGEIRHPEIRKESSSSGASTIEESNEHEEEH